MVASLLVKAVTEHHTLTAMTLRLALFPEEASLTTDSTATSVVAQALMSLKVSRTEDQAELMDVVSSDTELRWMQELAPPPTTEVTEVADLHSASRSSRILAMDTVQIRVVNALNQEKELLPQTAFPCAELPQQVRTALGSRPSRPVTLFHDGEPVGEELQVSPGDSMRLTAVVSDALGVEDRDLLLQKLQDAADEEDDDNDDFWECHPVRDAFCRFSEAARDDPAVVLAAVRLDGRCLAAASDLCRDDKDIVLAAVQQSGWALQYAGPWKDDRDVVLAAVAAVEAEIAFDGSYRGKEIGDDGARALAAALKANTTLQILDLDANNIGADGARALAAALEATSTLQGLYLDSNHIGADGARGLAAALEANSTLQELRLGYDNIGDDGARALAAALKANTTLQELYLDRNNIGDDGARALAAALEANTTLRALDLGRNNIEDGALKEQIAAALRRNTQAA